MNEFSKAIFRAIHERKWLQIEYENEQKQITKFWIGIIDLKTDHQKRPYLQVDALHIGQLWLSDEPFIVIIDRIISASVIEGSYQPKNEKLIHDIKYDPEKYEGLFGNVANLKILNYLAECNRLDTVPYYTDYDLLHLFDDDRLREQTLFQNVYRLSNEQFNALVRQFITDISHINKVRNIELALNILSVHMPNKKGLYVLAYRRLLLDIKNQCLRPDEDITICYEYEILEQKQSIRQFLNIEDYELLDNFEKN